MAALRDDVRSRPLLAFEALMPADRARFATRIKDEGWVLGSHPAVSLRVPIAWDVVAATNRSWHYHLHCWDAVGPLLAAFDEHADEEAFALALEIALDWATTFRTLRTSSPFAWYDMAVGLRAYRLGYLLDAAARRSSVPDADIRTLARSALLHREALDDDARFAGHSNHGLYQALGQVALARRVPSLPGMDASAVQGTARVARLAEEQFTAEGVHREHSPGYHLLILDALLAGVTAGLVHAPRSLAVCAQAEAALPWFVQPDRRLAMVGDTSYGFAPSAGYRDPGARFVASDGRDGAAPPSGLRVFPASGYAAVRTDWDKPTGSYLLQTGCFHSRAHKHADDLSVIWFDRGVQLLADAGRYGYAGRTAPGDGLWELGFNYSDPKRVYVESDQAHNTVEVDGGPRSRRDAAEYGSALVASGSGDGLHATLGRVRLASGVTHTRLLVLAPGRWLLLVDDLAADEPHAYRQRLLFGPELELVAGTEESPRLRSTAAPMTLSVTPLGAESIVDVVRGASEPRLLGWISRTGGTLEPTWTCAVAADGQAVHRFATVIAIDAVGRVRGTHDLGPRLQEGAVRWDDDAGVTGGVELETRGEVIVPRKIGGGDAPHWSP